MNTEPVARFLKRICGIDDEVREYLPQFSGKCIHKDVSLVAGFNNNAEGAEFAPLKRQHIVDKLGYPNWLGSVGITPVKSKGCRRNLPDCR